MERVKKSKLDSGGAEAEAGCIMVDMSENVQEFYQVAARSDALRVFSAQLDPLQGLVSLKNLPTIRDFRVPKSRVEKDAEQSTKARLDGNEAYMKRDLGRALALYNDSVRLAPVSTSDDQQLLSFAFGNRSAVLLDSGRHKECVNDVARAVLAGYPKDRFPRLLARRRACMDTLAANSMVQHAKKADENHHHTANNDENNDHDDEVPLEDIATEQLFSELTSTQFAQRYDESSSRLPKLSDAPHAEFWNISRALQFARSEEKGRHLLAARDIAPGEILIVEPPYSAVLDGRFWKSHCQHCMERTSVVIPCQTCASVVFCSEECRNLASRYHQLECPIIGNLADSSLCIRLDALRMVTKHPLPVLQGMRPTLRVLLAQQASGLLPSSVAAENDGAQGDTDVNCCGVMAQDVLPNTPGSEDDILNNFSLLTHLHDRNKDQFYEYALSAVYMFKALEETAYFDGYYHSAAAAGENQEEDDKDLVLQLLFLACLIRSTNSFTIVEDKLKLPDLWDSDRVRLGAGLFPMGSYLNHSCDPNTTRDFAHGCLIVAASCPIRRGEEVTALYYKTFQDSPRTQRQEYLKSMYLFDCYCDPCVNGWPTGPEMKRNPPSSLGYRISCPRCFKVQRVGDPLTLSKCQACQASLEPYSDKLTSSWTAVLKVFGQMERGDTNIAISSPHVMAEYMRASYLLVLPPDPDFYFAKGLFCRSLRIIRGLKHLPPSDDS
ncbi:unnamed protein product [Notodromas monacha]|uniref:Protein-lysine N-methyltransferase SMYD4 n=1 Tax=Notodromas monacha TaxID=399045 RepID=A0A7R9BYV4_9CRUS|nr:unnamed protein product [Notodromas monacha]CAG0923086.1 unnamed protein product [Notodromas monacha]